MKKLITGCLIVACAGWQSSANADDQQGLSLEVTPYAWLAGVDGDVRVGDRAIDIDQSFSDIVQNLDGVFMGMGVASFNRMLLLGQYDYIKLEAGRGDIDAELDTQIGTLAIGYRLGNKNTYDLMVGYRDADLELQLKGPAFRREGAVDVGDTILMLRPSIQLSEKWRLNPTIAYAISGDSDTHYELHPEFHFQVSDALALRFGYRLLHYKLSAGAQDRLTYRETDMDLSGLLLGISWTFR